MKPTERRKYIDFVIVYYLFVCVGIEAVDRIDQDMSPQTRNLTTQEDDKVTHPETKGLI